VWDLPTGEYAAGCAKSMLDWIGQAVGEGLNAGCDTFFTARNGSNWDLQYHNPAEFKAYTGETSHFVQPDTSGGIDARVRRFMERTRPPQHVQKTSVTALLRGAVLLPDQEETPESKRKALHLDTLPPELPAFMMEQKLSAADRGTAAHKALGALDISALRAVAGPERITCIRRQLADMQRAGTLTQEEAAVVDISDLVVFLQSPLGQRMLASPRVEREWGFCLMHEGILVQGILDLCFLQDGKWVLADYKTDHCPATELTDMYRDQILWYKKALEEITNIPVAEVWLYSLSSGYAVAVE